MGAAPIPVFRRAVLAAVLIALGLVCSSAAQAAPAVTAGGFATPARGAAQELWALEVDRVGTTRYSLKQLLKAKAYGINALIADPRRLKPKQIRRVRSWATQARIAFLRPVLVDTYASTQSSIVRSASARCAVQHRAKQSCVLMTRSLTLALKLARRGVADVVVLRLSGPRLPATIPTTPTPVLALAGLSATPTFNTPAWTTAIARSAAQPKLELGVNPLGPARGTALTKYLQLLAPKNVAGLAPSPVAVTRPPADPTGLSSATAADGSVTVTWIPAADPATVVGYRLFQDGIQVGTTTTNTYTFASLPCSATGPGVVSLGVAAYDAAGNTSQIVTVAQPTKPCPLPGDHVGPSRPGGFSASAVGQTSLTLNWSASSDNVGVVGYRVRKDGVFVATLSATSYTLTNLTCGTSYLLTVFADDAAGNGSAGGNSTQSTLPCAGDTIPPSTPAALVTSGVGQTAVTLDWTASTDDLAVTGYRLYQDGVQVGTSAGTSYTFSGLSCWTLPGAGTYTLGIAAYDAAGNLSAVASLSQQTLQCPPGDTTPPSIPSGAATSAVGQTSVTLSWTASSDNVAVLGYQVSQDGVQLGTASGTSYTFSGLACGTTYTLAASAFDAAGNASLPAALSQATQPCAPPADSTPPSTPAGLATSAISQTSIALSWTASTDNVGVTGYRISRNGTQVGTPVVTSYVFSGLSCGTSYTLGAAAVDAAANVSGTASVNTSTAPCPDTTPPSTPTGLVTSGVGQSSVTLNWTASTDNVGVTGYRTFRNGTQVGTPAGTPYVFSGLACGTSYTLGAAAVDAAGNVSGTATVSATTSACADTTPPSTPSGLVTSAVGQTSVTLSWTASTDNVGVAAYQVSRNAAPVTTTAGTSYTYSGLLCGMTYSLGVAAFDAAGNFSGTATVSATTSACAGDTTPPSTPAALATSAISQTSITLSWTAATDNVGVTGYRTFRNGTQVGTPAVTSYVFSGLSCGTSYTLGAAAFDAAGNVSATATVSATTSACPDTTPPSTPTGLATSAVSQSSVTLSWTASTDNVGVTGYRTFRDGTQVGTPAGTPYVFSGLACGTSYTLGAAAVDAAGNVSGTATVSATTSACADTTPPSTPSGLVTSAVGQTSVTLSWTASTDNVGVAAYQVSRNAAPVTTTVGTSYTYSGLLCGMTYSLGVAAFDAAGNFSGTATVSATTSACAGDTTPPSTPTGLAAKRGPRRRSPSTGPVDRQRQRRRLSALRMASRSRR